MRKSAEAFRTISEVADELSVPKHVLRFWEMKFPQVRPMKRGGGRRYYRPEDVELLSGIRALLHTDGYTIKGVQKILKEQGAEYAKAYGRAVSGNGSDQTAPVLQDLHVAAGSTRPTRRPRQKSRAARDQLHARVGNVISELESCRRSLRKALRKPAAASRKRVAAAAGG